jgi:hypothetical protein
MRTGMLWFDNDPKSTMAEKIRKAANYYERKYGSKPTLCFINPKNLEANLAVEGIQITASSQVLQGHYWLGVRDA